MIEKKLVWGFLFEGLLAFMLGSLMFALPMYTSITFALLVSIVLLIFGVYKFFQTFFVREYIEHFWLNLLLYLIIIAFATVLFLNPSFNLLIITSYIAAYLIFLGSSSISFAFQTKGLIRYWWINFIIALLEILAGTLILLTLPYASFLVIGMLLGASFVIIGAGVISFFVMAEK